MRITRLLTGVLCLLLLSCAEEIPEPLTRTDVQGMLRVDTLLPDNGSDTVPTDNTDQDDVEMALIPAGEFQMGDAFNEGDADERPVHTVYLDPYYMDVYEVTNAQYKKFIDATGHRTPYYWDNTTYNSPDQPVVGVEWNDAVAYCKWVGKRLPTEAEWEKAARGGLEGKRYPWGDEAPDANGIWRANYNPGNYMEDGYKYTAPVGSFLPNGYGLYDMAGNVWEWCADWHGENYYDSSPRENPTGPNSSSYRVLRGGAWVSNPGNLRVASRDDLSPTNRYYSRRGFRCVQD